MAHTTHVAQPDDATTLWCGQTRRPHRGVKCLQIHPQRHLVQFSTEPGELPRGVVGGDDDDVELFDESPVECPHGSFHTELPAQPPGKHVVKTFVAEQHRADPPATCPPGRLGEGPLVGHLDGCRTEPVQDTECTPRRRDHAVLLGDLRSSDLNDDAVLGLLDVVVLTGDDQDAVAPGLDVLLAQLVDGNFHAAGDGPDEVGELGDTESVGHQSSLLRHVKGGW